MDTMKNIGIFGVGGVGGFFGGKLCQANHRQNNVTFFARGEHLEEIRKNGLILKTEKEGELLCHPDLATDSIESIPSLDLCILCVKGFDLIPLLSRLKNRISENTILLPLLNGADIYDRIQSVTDKGIVLPACVYVGTHIEKPGVVAQKGGACKILLGGDPRYPNNNPEALLQILQQADILHEWRDDIQTCIWEKFIFIASFGIATAAHNKTIGQILEDEVFRNDVTNIIKEIVLVATKIGIPLPQDIVGTAINKATSFPFETKTSFQRDFEVREKADERELFAGTILKRAKSLGIVTPKTEELFEKLEKIKPSVLRNKAN